MSNRKTKRKFNRKIKKLVKSNKAGDRKENNRNVTGIIADKVVTQQPKAFRYETPERTLEEMFKKILTVSPDDSPEDSSEDSTGESEECEEEPVDVNEPGPSRRKVTGNRRKQLMTMAQILPSSTAVIEENAIFQAILSDNYHLLKVLLEDGNVSGEITWRETGETALHAVIKRDNNKMFHLLIAHGADINACLSPGKNCLYFAAGRNNYELVEYMCKIYSKSGKKWKEGYPGLFAASAMGNERIVDLLISSGVDMKARTDGFLTPLHIAVNRGYLKVAELLINRGFDVNETTAEGYSVLHYAVKRDSLVLVKMFLAAGADMRIRSIFNESPFFLAIRLGNARIVKAFIDYGADVNKF